MRIFNVKCYLIAKRHQSGVVFQKINFKKEWDGKTDILMQEGALVEDVGTFSNADEYLAKAEKF